MNNLNKIMNSCSKKQKCSICYENKYINYKCNQCLEGMICYDCSFQFIENGYNNKCPICISDLTLQKEITLKCGHKLCCDCFFESLKNKITKQKF